MWDGLNIIISPLNAVWICVAAAFVVVCVPLYFAFRKYPMERKRKVMLIISAANLALFCVYQLWFQYVPGTPYWNWGMLPINLCNLITIFLVAAFAVNKKWLYQFCFYVGIAAGFMAILSPEGGLKEMELFSPMMLGFYFVHCMLYTICILIAALKIYRPTYKSALVAVVQLEILTAVIYVINLILRNTVDKTANYFFLFEAGGSAYLEALHSIVPYPPFTMMVSVLPVAVGLFFLLTFIYKLFAREKLFTWKD